MTLNAALLDLARHPVRLLVRQWNWKAALFSAGLRSAIFFAANLSAGRAAAVSALMTELWFRLATAGFYGALTQAFRAVEPEWQGTLSAMVLLPVVAHSLEWAVHWQRGTAELTRSIGISAALTCVSTAFNVYAMRRGALTVGAGSDSLSRDLARMPRLIAGFVLAIGRLLLRPLSGTRRPPSTPRLSSQERRARRGR